LFWISGNEQSAGNCFRLGISSRILSRQSLSQEHDRLILALTEHWKLLLKTECRQNSLEETLGAARPV
jgi:hypothetical protein